MVAYGALVSLMNIIDSIEKHPSPPISIHKQQVESLTQNVTFLVEFLDAYISPVVAVGHEADPLERRITDAVYAAEDVIESQIVLQIHSRTTVVVEDHGFYDDLQKVIEEMNLIKKEVKKIAVEAQPVGGLTSSSTVKENAMVGFEEVFLEVLDKLTGGRLHRQIIPITGMGGIGKTTLAKNLFEDALVKEHFDIRVWTTISQTYNVRETLREIYIQASGGSSSDPSENELGEKLYKFLYGRRYLIVMDDMWSVDVWQKIKTCFPIYENGSRIIVTTRLSNLSSQLNESCRVDMKFLDKVRSWELFCKIVFGKESCPLELENIGKKIVANCKGLPLSIATIASLLAKSECTTEYWERIEQNLNSIVINNNDEFCLKVLRMSYIYLPNYLKPCFLYMGVFEEDHRIRVSMLEKLWISEGFLKPQSGKCLETIAQEYFKELVDRNLILIDKLGSTGNVKFCKIHDLLRDLCLKEAEKEMFYRVLKDDPLRINSERRVVLKTRGLLTTEVFRSLSRARSLICDYREGDGEVRLPQDLGLLRTFKAYYDNVNSWNSVYYLDNVFELVNSWYLAVRVHDESKFPSSIDLLWNLHTLIIYCSNVLIVPIEIWKLHQLRHLVFEEGEVIVTCPPSGDNGIVIMKNLQTLKGVQNLFLNEDVVERIPNVKKLHLNYYMNQMEGEKNCHSHLQCLSKLEKFHCEVENIRDEYLQRIMFPHSLRKLSIIVSYDMKLELEDTMLKIGSLPFLEKFVLKGGRFTTRKWETIEGQFPSLKFLQLQSCDGLEDWIVSDSSHFPLLQKLRLCYLGRLKEIPSEVGEIATLKSISLEYCRKSAVESAKKIVEEQEDLYGDQLYLHVLAIVYEKQEALKSLASANFKVEVGIL